MRLENDESAVCDTIARNWEGKCRHASGCCAVYIKTHCWGRGYHPVGYEHMGTKCFHCAGVMGCGCESIAIFAGVVEYEKLFHCNVRCRG